MDRQKCFLLLCCFAVSILCPLVGLCQTINPIDYGFLNAKTGVERYQVLLKCHKAALPHGRRVCYKGLKRIEIEIPENAQSIPLTSYTDFSGVTIVVKNTKKSLPLFTLSDRLVPLDTIYGEDIDRGEYTGYDNLRKGLYLLVVTDQNPWISNRKGYDYGTIRRDAFVVSNGRTCMRPISSYKTQATKPKAYYCPVDKKKKIIKNLTFIRAAGSTEITKLFVIQNQYNLVVSNVTIKTPDDGKLYGDAAIQLGNCVKVELNDITVNGTYSQRDKFGYGLSLGNVSNLTIKRMYAKSKWGVFGNNNIKDVVLKDCDINRFDIHCYGRDVKAIRCEFSEQYNQFSSFFGTLEYDKCSFTNFVPVLMESSFNAYTPFDIIWKNCTFCVGKRNNYLITLFGVPEAKNERLELRRKCLPNVYIKKCSVYLSEDVEQWYLIETGGLYCQDSFDYVSNIILKNIKVYNSANKSFGLFSEDVKTTNPLKTVVNIHER